MLGKYISAKIQIDKAATLIQSDKNLRDGYIGIGLSQGGLLLRAIAQKLSQPTIKVLITLGSPHQGIFGRNSLCNLTSSELCHYLSRTFSKIAYHSIIQKFFSIASYWNDPYNPQGFIQSCQFLPMINHDIEDVGEEITNFKNIPKLILVKFKQDLSITPLESAWFGFYKPYSIDVASYNKTNFYKQNKLGFKEMVVDGRVEFIELPGAHLEFSYDWLINMLNKYLL